jgi:hypothetical protein
MLEELNIELEELNIELMDVSLRTGTAMCDYSGS